MKKIILGVLLLSILFGCNREKRWEEKITVWEAPNWTSDGKVVFLEHYYVQKWKQTATGDAQVGGSEKITVCEISNDGTGLKKLAIVKENEFNYGPCLGGISSSSIGDWIALSIEDWDRGEHYPVMYVIKRDGSELREVGSGRNPDFSPDTSNFVYEKTGQGLWIMNKDGTGDKQIITDITITFPSWSSNSGRIAAIKHTSGEFGFLSIFDSTGNLLQRDSTIEVAYPDWGPSDSNAISANDIWFQGIIFYLTSNKQDTLQVSSGAGLRWSPNGEYFICYGGTDGYFIIKKDNTNKWYLKP
ncbi:MAG: hypothetical protein WC614_02390 [bacterium]